MNSTALDIYNRLYARYGDLGWWPARTPYEVMTGAVLTQNTAWSNVEKAVANFGGGLLPESVAGLSLDRLSEIIRPSGFFNQKAVYLKALTAWFSGYGYEAENVKALELEKARRELLSVKGVGKETADSILLYAFGFSTFVADAYTKRLLTRLALDVRTDYDSIKRYFESNLPRDTYLYNNFHAMIVINAKEHCKKTPQCSGCPLAEMCPEHSGFKGGQDG